jgi:hypothetical protein
MEFSKESNADLIRTVGEDMGFHHSNKFIKDYILSKYKRTVSVQSIAQTLGRYRDRQYVDATNAHIKCRGFLQACANDYNLAKKILANYGGAV